MIRIHNFHSVEFFRKIRDEHAALLSDRSPEEIVSFFNSRGSPDKGFQQAQSGTLNLESPQPDDATHLQHCEQ